MRNYLTTGAALLLTTTAAHAVGLDRSFQDIGAIFADGNFVELSFGSIRPDVDGVDNPTIAGALGAPISSYDDVAEDYTQLSGSLTYHFDDRISVAVIIDEPFGANILYPGAGASTLLGGTAAELNSTALTTLGRYKIDENFSVHGGFRYERLDANITLSGLAFTPSGLNGYNVDLDDSSEFGYVLGAAYERPDIALRVALTYFSSITHDFDSTELGVVDGITSVETPEAWNLDFQTGVAQDTLVFGQIRFAGYDRTRVSPPAFVAGGGDSLTDLELGRSLTLGVAHRFTEAFAGSITVGYDSTGEDNLISPLAPSNGNRSISIGGQYTVGDVVLSGGIRYVDLGDAIAAPGGSTPVALFNDNDAVALGLSVGYNF